MKRINLALAILLLSLTTGLYAQPGSLDSDFNANGKVTTDFNSSYDFLYSLAVQTDGKIIAAGYSTINSISYFALARYNVDGTLDNTFSVDGKVTTAIGASDDETRSVAIQPDGKIVVCGFSNNGTDDDFALARYNSDGTLDLSFGTNGKVTTAIGSSNDLGTSLVIQPDGRIIVAGFAEISSNFEFAAARYNTNGSLDTDFGINGKVITPVGISDGRAYSVALQTDGKILLAGVTMGATDADFALIRYNSYGALDTSFNHTGKVITPVGTGEDEALAMTLQSDGKIILAGYSFIGSQYETALVRYNTNGNLDNSFGVGGKVNTAIDATDDKATAVKVQVDNKIVVGGYSDNSTDYNFALLRYNSNGALDTTFGTKGKVTTAIGTNNDMAYALAIQPNYRIVLGGISSNGPNYDFGLARYLSGLNVGVLEFSNSNHSALIYPNPIKQNATLEYTLNNKEQISIRLTDMLGRTITTFINNKTQDAGNYKQTISIPNEIPSGSYFIIISNENGQESVKIIK